MTPVARKIVLVLSSLLRNACVENQFRSCEMQDLKGHNSIRDPPKHTSSETSFSTSREKIP